MSIGPALILLGDYLDVVKNRSCDPGGHDLFPAMDEVIRLLVEHVRLRFESRSDLLLQLQELRESCVAAAATRSPGCPNPVARVDRALEILSHLRHEMCQTSTSYQPWEIDKKPAERLHSSI